MFKVRLGVGGTIRSPLIRGDDRTASARALDFRDHFPAARPAAAPEIRPIGNLGVGPGERVGPTAIVRAGATQILGPSR